MLCHKGSLIPSRPFIGDLRVRKKCFSIGSTQWTVVYCVCPNMLCTMSGLETWKMEYGDWNKELAYLSAGLNLVRAKNIIQFIQFSFAIKLAIKVKPNELFSNKPALKITSAIFENFKYNPMWLFKMRKLIAHCFQPLMMFSHYTTL